jgi:hypothetical protein
MMEEAEKKFQYKELVECEGVGDTDNYCCNW